MKILIGFLILIFTSYGFAIEQIPNLKEARYEIFTSGQPTEMGFQMISDRGIRTIINLLPTNESLENEGVITGRLDLKYYQVPVTPNSFTVAKVREFSGILKTAEKPVLIHCATGNRAGGMWFVYRILVERAAIGTALKEARNLGMKTDLENILLDFVMTEKEKELQPTPIQASR